MRNGSNVTVEAELGVTIYEVMAEDMAERIVKEWKPEYGSLLDYGGGVKDATCFDLLGLCSEDPKKLKKLFPFLTLANARDIISVCKEAVARDI